MTLGARAPPPKNIKKNFSNPLDNSNIKCYTSLTKQGKTPSRNKGGDQTPIIGGDYYDYA